MTKMFLLFSHELTEEQKDDAKESLGVQEFIELPKYLKDLWENIPPELETLEEYLTPFVKYFADYTNLHDYILIQGEPTATCFVAGFTTAIGCIPIAATTKRVSSEQKMPDGTVRKTNEFKHVRFRKY